MNKIGFIGLGLMGSAMVERLQARSYHLSVLANRSRTSVEAALQRGAQEAANAKQLAEQSDIIMLCVDTSASVEARMLGADGVIAGLSAGKIVIDFGTSLPASTRKLYAAVQQAGASYIDAPLGRTPQHAKDGLLNIMAAGDKAAFEQAKPVLDDLGENVFYIGASGAGHTTKLFNNFFGMSVANAISEVFAMAEAAQLPRETIYQVIAAGPLRSGMMDFVKAYAIDKDPSKLAFSIANGAKDVGYYCQMLEQLGLPSPTAPALQQTLKAAADQGYAHRHVSELVDFHAQRQPAKQ